MEQTGLFNSDKYEYRPESAVQISRRSKAEQVRSRGSGTDGKTCRDCDNLIKKEYHDKIYYKCELIGNSNGTGTDIRLKWAACYYFKLPL